MKDHLANPGELCVHTLEDIQSYDSFIEFVLGNGEMRTRVDALHSQHLNGANKRSAPLIHIVDAWGDPSFPYFRNRPAGIFVSGIGGENGAEVGVSDIVEYRQSLEPQAAVLETDYAWSLDGATGRSHAEGFMSHADRHLMVHSYTDTVEAAGFHREFAVHTRVPYHSRSIDGLKDFRDHLPPRDAEIQIHPEGNLATIRFTLKAEHWQTEVVWAIGCLGPTPEWSVDEENGGVVLRWSLPEGKSHEATVVCLIMTDRDVPDGGQQIEAGLKSALSVGFEGLRQQHADAWSQEWQQAQVRLPDPYFQKLWEVSRYHLLCNVGGSYWGNIAVDEYAWDTHMLDSVISAHALLETGHVDLIKKHLSRLDDGFLKNARENARAQLSTVFDDCDGEAAILCGFLSEDGKAYEYSDNHFWIHGPQMGAHALALCKTASYSEDTDFLRNLVYPWLRGFAEYARKIAVDRPDLGTIYPVTLSGTVGDLHWSVKIKDMSLEGPNYSNVDAALTFKRVMETAADLASRLGLDESLAQKWLQVAANTYLPQTPERFLYHSEDDGKNEQFLPGPIWGLFWPNEWMFEQFPVDKVEGTLANHESRCNEQIVSWNRGFAALARTFMGDGDKALELAEQFFEVCDPRMVQMRDNTGPIQFFEDIFVERGAEPPPNKEICPGYVYYYDLSYAVYLLIIRNMLLQERPDGEVVGFPAIPAAWGEVEFSGLPISDGRRVSGKWSNGKGEIQVI